MDWSDIQFLLKNPLATTPEILSKKIERWTPAKKITTIPEETPSWIQRKKNKGKMPESRPQTQAGPAPKDDDLKDQTFEEALQGKEETKQEPETPQKLEDTDEKPGPPGRDPDDNGSGAGGGGGGRRSLRNPSPGE